MPNPLTDELTDEAKQILAAQFRYLAKRLGAMDVQQQRFINRHWELAGVRWR